MNLVQEVKHFIIKTIILATIFGLFIGFVYVTTWSGYTNEPIFEYGPILSWTDDPRTTITITWQWTEEREGYIIYWNSTYKGIVNVSGVLISATLRNLTPGCVYNYIIGYFNDKNPVNWTIINTFRTAPATVEPFTFMVQTDTQVHELGFGSFDKFIESALHENFSFMLHLGDLVQADKNYYMWQKFLQKETILAKDHPLMAILGNHEYLEYGRNEARNYRKYLTLPGNEFWYTFNYSNAIFVALGVYDYENFTLPDEERAMLEHALSDTSKWRIVYFHIPVVDFYLNDVDPDIFNELLPIFNKYKPDLVLMGHIHGYGRATINGTTYVILNSAGGITTPVIPDARSVESYSFTYGYAIVKVDGNKLYFYFKDYSGTIIDQFILER